jgi:hypothetical protein
MIAKEIPIRYPARLIQHRRKNFQPRSMIRSVLTWAVVLLPVWSIAQTSDSVLQVVEGVGVPGLVQLQQRRDSIELNWGKSDQYYYTIEKASVKENRTFKQVIKGRVGVEKYRSYYERFGLYLKYDRYPDGQRVRQIQLESLRYVTSKGIHVGSTRSEVIDAYGPLDGNVARYTSQGIECVLECDQVTQLVIFTPF